MSNKIKDVAKRAGVSTATVSRVFNQYPHVRKASIDAVLAAARELNYAPNASCNQSRIGIMIRGDVYINLVAYEIQLIAWLSRKFFKHGYKTELVSDQQISLLHKNSFSVLIILSNVVNDALFELGIPIVLINNLHPAAHSVVTNHFQGIKLAVEHLITLGHEKIAYISGDSHSWGYLERLRGYKESLSKYNIEYDDKLHIDTDMLDIVEKTVKVMSKNPTAMIISGEGRAQRLVHVLYLLGKKIPEDISVISFEDEEISQYLTPPHTTISQNIPNLALVTAELAMDVIKNETDKTLRNIVLHNEIIIRESTQGLES